jgi:uncharacterized damage-inducible protein DinB
VTTVELTLIDRYAVGPQTLRQAVAGLPREQQLARPIAGRWSTLEVVCHLADMEAVYAERMKRVIAENGPTFFDADADGFAAALAYHERDLNEELALIESTRRQMTRILRSLPPESFARQGTHSTAGALTLEKLLASATNHLAHHVPFILEKRRKLCR